MNTRKIKCLLTMLLLGLILPVAANAAVTTAKWTGLDSRSPTDLATAGNWDPESVPELDTTLAQPDGPIAQITNLSANLSFTMSRDLYLNGLQFSGNSSKFDFDLTGRKLRLYGYTGLKDGQQLLLRTNDGSVNDILFRNGTLDVTGAYSGKYPYFAGSTVAFSGTYFPTLTSFSCLNNATLYLTNGVTGKVTLTTQTSSNKYAPKIIIAGEKTVIDQDFNPFNLSTHETNAGGELYILDGAHLTNSIIQVGQLGGKATCVISNASVYVTPKSSQWFGVGIGAKASNDVLRITGGSKIFMKDYTFKQQLFVGRIGCSNLVEISGQDTTVNWSLTDGAVCAAHVGEASLDNFFHITDKASFDGQNGKGTGAIGAGRAGYLRADVWRNTVRVDGGAYYRVDSQSIGDCVYDRSGSNPSEITSVRRDANGTVTNNQVIAKLSDADYCYTVASNRFIVSGAGTAMQAGAYIYVSGSENKYYRDYASYNLFRVESNATANCGLALYVGKRGYQNGIEVDAGARLDVGKYNLEIGDPTNSTNSYVRVSDASTLAVNATATENGYLRLLGSGEGGEALLDITGGSAVSANRISTTGARNAIRLENGTLFTTVSMTYPSGDDASDAIRFEIAGTNSQVLTEHTATGRGSITFKSGVSFDFKMTKDGYVRAPFYAEDQMTFSGVPTVSFAGLKAAADVGGGKFTLFEAKNALTVDDAVVAAFDAASKAFDARAWVRLVDGKKLVLRVPSHLGACIIIR